MLANAVILDEDSITTQSVSMGTRVTVVEEGDDEPWEIYIVGSQEANPVQDRISDESPGEEPCMAIASATVIVEAPDGNIKYKIIAIAR